MQKSFIAVSGSSILKPKFKIKMFVSHNEWDDNLSNTEHMCFNKVWRTTENFKNNKKPIFFP